MDTPIVLVETGTGADVQRILVLAEDVIDKDALDLLTKLLAHV
jgi:hypothetical protein